MNLDSLAKISKGTGRKKREINLLDVSYEMKSLYNKYKSLSKISKIVKLSPEMVREFLKINELEKGVKELIRIGKINSVDIGYRISKLNKNDQHILGKNIVDKNLSSGDVRYIVKYKVDNPKMSIEKVIIKTMESKDKKIYVTYLGIENDIFEKFLTKIGNKNKIKIIRSIFNNVISTEFIVSFELNGRVVILKILKNGLKNMRNKSKELKIKLSKLANALIEEYLKGNKI